MATEEYCQTTFDTGSVAEVLPYMDAGLRSLISDDCVVKGAGNEYEISYSASSLQVSFSAGSMALVGGSAHVLTKNAEITLQANQPNYIVARVDKNQANLRTGVIAAITESQIKKEVLFGAGSVHDLLLYVVTTNSNGVTNVQDKRIIRGGTGKDIIEGTLAAGQTSITLSSDKITTNSYLSFYTSIYGINPETAMVQNGSVTLTFEAQGTDMRVGVGIDG